MSIATISPKQLQELIQSGRAIELIDVRTPVEYREVHVTAAQNVPLDQLDAGQIAASRAGKTEPLYVICKSGSRGRQACEKLVAAGCTQIFNVEGGTSACEQAGLAVVRGKKCISLERQVRIVAGAMVLTGAALGYFVQREWIGLSAFVGAGLMFAGITDTCGMALILARMPWNKVGPSASAASCSMQKPSCCS